MLEIIACILIGRRFSKTAEAKGLPKGKWAGIGVASFLVTSIIFAVIIVLATEEPLSAIGGYVAGGIVCAIAFSSLKNKPEETGNIQEFGTAPKDKNFEEPV